jgi:flavin reductase (DIM6/NTAB) family NADH-FMN oxidoreductase RutF
MPFIQVKPGTLLSPAPVVMVSCAGKGLPPNIITIAWTGTDNSDPPMLSISVRPQRYSHDIIRESGEFVVNLVDKKLIGAADLCGVRSGRDVNKFELCGLQPEPAQGMNDSPAIAQSPVWLGCKVKQSLVLGSHTMFIGEIISVGVRDELLDNSGKIDFTKAGLIAYCHGEYIGLTASEGFFGFSVANPEVLKRRMKK